VNAEYLQWFVGLTEGDGTFNIILDNKSKTALHRFIIKLSVRDTQLIYKIKSTLGFGRIESSKDTISFIVTRKDQLKDFILPIFDLYPCITRKSFQYLVFKETLLDRINGTPLRFKPEYSKDIGNSSISIGEILKLPYFDNWLIGFIEAEGSFSISKEDNGNRIRPYFSIEQKYDHYVMEAIRLRLNFTSKVSVRRDNMSILTGKSKREIENVINFISFTKTKITFQGYKHQQFKKWILEIGKLPNYQHIKLPYNY
jgi:LAGLIDADG endonuclease